MSEEDLGLYTEGDYSFGEAEPAPLVLDVDGDGEITATLQNRLWTSSDADLASLLNARVAETGLRDDNTILADARMWLGLDIGDDA